MVLHLKPGEQGFYHFQSLSASFAVQPGPPTDRYHNVYWFDPQDMKPLINQPGPRRGARAAAAAGRHRPRRPDRLAAAAGLGLLPARQGGDDVHLGRSRRLVPGRDPLPGPGQLRRRDPAGLRRYWDREHAAWVEPAEPNRVGNTTGGSWHGVLLAGGQNSEAAYSFLALMAIKPFSLVGGAAWLDRDQSGLRLPDAAARGRGAPGRLSQGRLGPRRPRGLSYRLPGRPSPPPPCCPTCGSAAPRPTGPPSTPSSPPAMGGRKTAQQALDDTAAAWNQITDQLGRSQQLQEHQQAIAYQPGKS